MPQFDIASFGPQLFWLALVFGGLYLAISKLIAPRTESILGYRSHYIEEKITAAETYNERARYLRQQKEHKIREVHTTVEALQKNATVELEQRFLARKADLEAVISNKAKKSLAEIQKYTDSFHKDRNKSQTDLAAFIIERVTHKPADLKLLKKFVK